MEKLSFIEKLEGERNWVSHKFDVELQLTVQKAMPIVQGKVSKPQVDGSASERKTYETALKSLKNLITVARCIILFQCKIRTEDPYFGM